MRSKKLSGKQRLIRGLLGLALGVIVLGYLLPSRWTVERSTVIDAPPRKIYPLIASFKTGWPRWSGFDTEDPDIQYLYSGRDKGLGATRYWTSKKMGDGYQTITKADPGSGVEFRLVMQSHPFEMTGRIALEPAGQSTRVIWTDTGDVGPNPLRHYIAAMMEKMMGRTFENSLVKLKQESEADATRHKSSRNQKA